jgi:hypothetical protein
MDSKVEYGNMTPINNGQHAHYHGNNPVSVVSKGVTQIAESINDEITRQVDSRVKDVLEDGGKDEWIGWFQGEVEHWKQRAEELEIELECMRNAFPEHDHDVSPKRRGLY